MSTVRRQQLEEIIECLGSPLRTEMYHVLGSEALSAELRGMLAARVHQDSGELVQRYLLFMDPGRHRSGARGSSSHPLPLRRFHPFPARRLSALRMPQHHLSRRHQWFPTCASGGLVACNVVREVCTWCSTSVRGAVESHSDYNATGHRSRAQSYRPTKLTRDKRPLPEF